MKKKSISVGSSWSRFEDSPGTPAADSDQVGNGGAAPKDGMSTRMRSLRNTLDTLRQKIKLPGRHNAKRLTNCSVTPSPINSARKQSSPGASAQTSSIRRSRREVKMYSPFEIITPVRTPAGHIKMGTQSCKRFTFSSPGNGNLENEVHAIVSGMQNLNHVAAGSPSSHVLNLHRRSRGRTTPKTSQSCKKY